MHMTNDSRMGLTNLENNIVLATSLIINQNMIVSHTQK